MSVAPKSIAAPDQVAVRRALLSVSDKTGLIDLAAALAARGVELISTGGTAKAIAAAGLAVKDVSDVTGFPEIMDGRVKTLHPGVHGGLLGIRDDEGHAAAMAEHGIGAIDLLVVNLYPFQETVAKTSDWATAIENIDIGGPAMIRAAAKNHAYVAVVVDPAQYADVMAAIEAGDGTTTLRLRKKLALAAYGRTATYDAAVSNWLADQLGEPNPRYRAIGGELVEVMRYGENPHQLAAFYRTGEKRFGVTTATQLQGKTLSYNNINDTDAAYELVAEFDPKRTAAVAIIKHANPCGVAEAKTLKDAYLKALACDPVSAFGGIVALNRTLDAEAAEEIVKIFTEVIIAPDATDEAKAIVAAKKNLRLLLAGGLPKPAEMGLTVKTVAGGFLAQTRDYGTVDDIDLEVKTRRQPTGGEEKDMAFAFRVVKHVKSNAIVFVKDGATVGIGAGQMSRVDSARIAVSKATEAAKAAGLDRPLTEGSVAASDAFFPFADGLETIVAAGATAVIQPGGSMRDNEVIEAADKAGIAMAFTGMRHFRH
ncbi:phosphoribosylaminoimidazolecarboxamide formyltransferase [Prosthecomicrobium hirschii]|uniref:Bifunctional purine biosynthesis protein PurH n=1 Tax=Prosthecodimorpha hirschii TaxID=665126 RepID=A0A0P6VR17_9HYPH|nr:bifunctional phosphoribosylaminoimidazolecarboxamide formyltransferase/IMP cyclohydrolase [Prosthecomicrobium hirschii]KPL53643.1 phosphoribosylaminoimidazolecarboxamide formyltransferase [Prosthecomicrobium hirschii]